MAKKTKTAPEAPATNTEAAPAANAAEKGANDRFARVFKGGKPVAPVNEKGEAAKLAPQAQAILNTLEAVGAEGCTRKELIEKLSVPGVLTTRQPVGRILSYYQKDLVKSGAATHTKA